MSKATDHTTGISLMPHGVKFSANATRGTVAMLRPMLSATRSIKARRSFPGTRAAIAAYPGKKSTYAVPSAMRTVLAGKNIMVMMVGCPHS